MPIQQILALSLLLFSSSAASIPSYADLALSSASGGKCTPNFPYECPNDPTRCCSGSTGCCDSEDTCSWSYTCGSLCQNRACTCSTDANCLRTYNVNGATPYCCSGTCQSECPAPGVSPSPLPTCCSAQCGGSQNVCSGQCVSGITQCQCTGACTAPYTQCIENACSAGSTGLDAKTAQFLIFLGCCAGAFGLVSLIYFTCKARLKAQGAQSGAANQGMQPGAYQGMQPGVYQGSMQPVAYQPAAQAPPTVTHGAYQQTYQSYHPPAPQPGPIQGMQSGVYQQPAAQAPLIFTHPRKEQQPLLAVGVKTSV